MNVKIVIMITCRAKYSIQSNSNVSNTMTYVYYSYYIIIHGGYWEEKMAEEAILVMKIEA